MIDTALEAIPESGFRRRRDAQHFGRSGASTPSRLPSWAEPDVASPRRQHHLRRGSRRRLREPGTTRDAIYLTRATAEIHADRYRRQRRRGKVFEAVEKFSVIKTLQAIEDAHRRASLDAEHAITEQDAHLTDILEAGRAVVVGIK
jgi:hypothetical protein